MELPERLKLIRKELNITQADIAQLLSITQAGYSRIERGDITPTSDKLFLIAKKYPQINTDWLLMGEGPMLKKNRNAPHIGIRLSELINSLHLTEEEFASKIGVSPLSLEPILSGQMQMYTGFRLKIISAFPEVSERWLRIGEGSMFKDTAANDIKQHIDIPSANKANPLNELTQYGIQIRPHFDSMVACGTSGFEMMLKNEDSKLRGLPIMADYDFSVIAGGNSMINWKNPNLSIAPGDIMAFKISSGKFIEWGEVYAIATSDGIIAKKLAVSDREESIKCLSYNEEEGYAPFEINGADIFGLAKLVGIVRVNMLSNH